MAPKLVLFANLGAVQLNYGIGLDDARRLVESWARRPLPAPQPAPGGAPGRGDTDFRGLEPKIAALCAALDAPVIAKSVGSGIAPSTAARLLACGVAAIDVAGAGGTSWALVEGKRADDPARDRIAQAFGDWGYATPRATAALRAALSRPRWSPAAASATASKSPRRSRWGRPGRPGAALPARRRGVRGGGRRADRRAAHGAADRPLRDRLAHRRRPARRPDLTEGHATVLSALVLAAALASPSPSPSPSPAPPTAIGSVTVVSGSPQSLHRSPQAASVLDARTLRGSTAPALDGALRALPGLDRNRSNAPFTNYGQLRLSFAGPERPRRAVRRRRPGPGRLRRPGRLERLPGRVGRAGRAAARAGLGALRLGRDRRGALADHRPARAARRRPAQRRRRRRRPGLGDLRRERRAGRPGRPR